MSRSTDRNSVIVANLDLVDGVMASMRILGDEDARQEGCIALIRAVRRYKPSRSHVKSVKPLAIMAIRNAIIDLGRKRGWQRMGDAIQALPWDQRGPNPGQLREAKKREAREGASV